jgi:hypothetical protein
MPPAAPKTPAVPSAPTKAPTPAEPSEPDELDEGPEGADELEEDAEPTGPPTGTEPSDDGGGDPADKDPALATEATPADTTEFTLNDETVTLADLKEAYGHVQNSVKVFQAVQKREAAVNKFVEALHKDPTRANLDVFTHKHGGNREQGYADMVEWAAGFLNAHLKNESLPEEARQAMRYQHELAAAREEIAEIKRLKDEETHTQSVDAAETALASEITAAAKAAGIDSPSETLIIDVAAEMYASEQRGFRPDPKRALARVIKERKDAHTRYLSDDAKIEEIPPALIKRIREFDLAAVKSGKSKATSGPTTSPRTIRMPERKVLI